MFPLDRGRRRLNLEKEARIFEASDCSTGRTLYQAKLVQRRAQLLLCLGQVVLWGILRKIEFIRWHWHWIEAWKEPRSISSDHTMQKAPFSHYFLAVVATNKTLQHHFHKVLNHKFMYISGTFRILHDDTPWIHYNHLLRPLKVQGTLCSV